MAIIIENILGKVNETTRATLIDWLPLEWFETQKRVLRKHTEAGREVSLKFLDQNPRFGEGDILYQEPGWVIAVKILPCDCLIIRTNDAFSLASACYEIGNKHLPLFYETGELLVPFDQPLQSLLTSQGYEVKRGSRKLLQALRTTVAPHTDASESLFTRILKRTTA